jgi:hypothetical protein
MSLVSKHPYVPNITIIRSGERSHPVIPQSSAQNKEALYLLPSMSERKELSHIIE